MEEGFCRPPYWTALMKSRFFASSSLKYKLNTPHRTKYTKANILAGSRDLSVFQ
jgi:hypothetical protein